MIHADDATLLFKGLNVDNMIQDITNQLPKIISWFNCNKLRLKANNSTFITFHTNQTQYTKNKHRVIDNIGVYKSSSTNSLGIIIDETLTWLPKSQFMSTKIAKTIGILRRLIKKRENKNILLILFDIFILLYLSYSCIA